MKTERNSRRELAQRLKEDIYRHERKAGERVGSVRQLALRYHASTLTIARMLDDLIEEGVLCHDENGWFRILQEPPVLPRIGYAGYPLLPHGSMDCLREDATKKLYREFERLEVSPRIIGFHELRDMESARVRLKGINGLLLNDGFVDDVTMRPIRELDMPIVRIGQAFADDMMLTSSEVVQCFDPALEKFAAYCDLKSYRRIMVLHHNHYSNSVKLTQKINAFLKKKVPKTPIENIVTQQRGGWNDAEMAAYCVFQEMEQQSWKDTLLVSTSGYCTRGVCRVLRSRGELPDILSVDNLEGYEKSALFSDPYFTAIDRNMGRIFCEALKLLCEQVRTRDERKVVIKIPAKLVIRKSITHVNSDWRGGA
ncbi:MAG: substrate-binding domain-containing protein [Victivallales bacterium]|nr:substrate-binding domain-containing protein [Victivallales bacterium]